MLVINIIIIIVIVMVHEQLDNQLSGAVFPIVISSILPPKSVAIDSGQFRLLRLFCNFD